MNRPAECENVREYPQKNLEEFLAWRYFIQVFGVPLERHDGHADETLPHKRERMVASGQSGIKEANGWREHLILTSGSQHGSVYLVSSPIRRQMQLQNLVKAVNGGA